MTPKTKLLDQVRQIIRTKNYMYKTEVSYTDWIYRFIMFHNNQHPKDIREKEISEFLTFLAVKRKVSASTQYQALNALTFLYKKVLKIQLKDFSFKHSKVGERVPIVLSRNEVKMVLSVLRGEAWLMVSLLYGCGLKLAECLKLRVKDVDFDLNEIVVTDGKGDNDHRTIFPVLLKDQIKLRINNTKIILKNNLLIKGFNGVSMPEAIEQKYTNAPKELAWQYLFPSRKPTINPRSGKLKQHHRDESFLQKAVKTAVKKVGITKNAGCYTFRHSFATHLLEDGYCIRIVQKLLSHKNIRTTKKYTHILNQHKPNVRSPLDSLNFE